MNRFRSICTGIRRPTTSEMVVGARLAIVSLHFGLARLASCAVASDEPEWLAQG